MIKQSIKQAIQTLKENRLTCVVSILGTALSVAMILVMVLQFQIREAGYSPVSNRSRTLYTYSVSSKQKNGNNQNNTGLSYKVVKECFYSLKVPEAVTATVQNTLVVSLPGKQLFDEYQILYTDCGFWKVFDFRFLYGKAFTEADFVSGLPRVVITDKLAAHLFGTVEVVGRDLLLNNVVACTITGVVETPSRAAGEAYADVWLPFTSNTLYTDNGACEDICGSFAVITLARSTADFAAIQADLQQEVVRYNSNKVEWEMIMPVPDSHLEQALGFKLNEWEGWKRYVSSTGLLLLFLLLVPTLNLTSLIQSSVQKRRSEMGLRKAFGATRERLFCQLLSENLVVTLIGGLIGIALSILLLYLCKSFLLYKDTVITFGMLFQPGLFIAALFFTLLLNLLSSGLPAFRVTREQIVESLKEGDK